MDGRSKLVRRASSATAIMAVVYVVMAAGTAHGADKWVAPIWKLKGHTLFVEAVALSSDGRLAVSGSRDQTVRLWDLGSGKEIRRFEGHTTDVRAVAFSPDSRFVSSGSGDRYAARNPNWPNDSSVRVWEVDSGKQIHRFDAHTLEVCSVVFSPDGRTVASGGADGRCVLWNLETGRERLRLPTHKGAIASLAFSPDGKQILSASETGELSLWNASTGEVVLTYGQDIRQVNCVAFSADGRLIVSGHNQTAIHPSGSMQGAVDRYPDCSVRIWETDSGKLLHRFAWKDFGPACVVFSPNADRVAAIAGNGLRIWKLPEGQSVEGFQLEGSAPAALRLLPQGFDALVKDLDIWFYRYPGDSR